MILSSVQILGLQWFALAACVTAGFLLIKFLYNPQPKCSTDMVYNPTSKKCCVLPKNAKFSSNTKLAASCTWNCTKGFQKNENMCCTALNTDSEFISSKTCNATCKTEECTISNQILAQIKHESNSLAKANSTASKLITQEQALQKTIRTEQKDTAILQKSLIADIKYANSNINACCSAFPAACNELRSDLYSAYNTSGKMKKTLSNANVQIGQMITHTKAAQTDIQDGQKYLSNAQVTATKYLNDKKNYSISSNTIAQQTNTLNTLTANFTKLSSKMQRQLTNLKALENSYESAKDKQAAKKQLYEKSAAVLKTAKAEQQNAWEQYGYAMKMNMQMVSSFVFSPQKLGALSYANSMTTATATQGAVTSTASSKSCSITMSGGVKSFVPSGNWNSNCIKSIQTPSGYTDRAGDTLTYATAVKQLGFDAILQNSLWTNTQLPPSGGFEVTISPVSLVDSNTYAGILLSTANNSTWLGQIMNAETVPSTCSQNYLSKTYDFGQYVGTNSDVYPWTTHDGYRYYIQPKWNGNGVLGVSGAAGLSGGSGQYVVEPWNNPMFNPTQSNNSTTSTQFFFCKGQWSKTSLAPQNVPCALESQNCSAPFASTCNGTYDFYNNRIGSSAYKTLGNYTYADAQAWCSNNRTICTGFVQTYPAGSSQSSRSVTTKYPTKYFNNVANELYNTPVNYVRGLGLPAADTSSHAASAVPKCIESNTTVSTICTASSDLCCMNNFGGFTNNTQGKNRNGSYNMLRPYEYLKGVDVHANVNVTVQAHCDGKDAYGTLKGSTYDNKYGCKNCNSTTTTLDCMCPVSGYGYKSKSLYYTGCDGVKWGGGLYGNLECIKNLKKCTSNCSPGYQTITFSNINKCKQADVINISQEGELAMFFGGQYNSSSRVFSLYLRVIIAGGQYNSPADGILSTGDAMKPKLLGTITVPTGDSVVLRVQQDLKNAIFVLAKTSSATSWNTIARGIEPINLSTAYVKANPGIPIYPTIPIGALYGGPIVCSALAHNVKFSNVQYDTTNISPLWTVHKSSFIGNIPYTNHNVATCPIANDSTTISTPSSLYTGGQVNRVGWPIPVSYV